MRSLIRILLTFALLNSAGCFHMKHEFDGTVYYNNMKMEPGQTTGHADRKKMCGFALWGLIPWNKEPTRSAVPTSGKELTVKEIKTQFTIVDIVVSLVLNYFIGGGVIFQPRTVYAEGDYLLPDAGPAPTDAVYQ
jgi:hypothetical protein